jgi:exopolysaccharide production protein ExoZ
MHAASGQKALVGMRGVFAALVFLSHFHVQFHYLTHDVGATFIASSAIWCLGRAAVLIFFTVSGFLFYGRLLKREEPYVTFVSRRLHRLYPTFLFAFSIYLILCFLFPAQSKLHGTVTENLLYIAANLLMLQGFLHPPMIVQSWSLTFTCVFYVLVPAVVWVFRKAALGPRQRLLALGALWVLALASIKVSGVMVSGVGFITGALMVELLPIFRAREGKLKGRVEILAWALIIAVWVMLYINFRWHTKVLDAAIPRELTSIYVVICRQIALSLTTIVVFTLALERAGAMQRGLGCRPLVALGKISYSWYLMHGLVLKATAVAASMFLLPAPANSFLWFVPVMLLAFAASWVAASCSFYLVESRFSFGAKPRALPLVAETA